MATQRKRFRKIKQGKEPKTKSPHPQKMQKINHAPAHLKIKAFLTDAFMLLMPIIYTVFYLVMDGREDFANHRTIGWVLILAPLVVVQTLFFAIASQTPGYRAYALTLVDARTGQRASFGAIVFRNLMAILSFFTLFGWLIMFFRKDKKTLHDLLSTTMVISKP